MDTDFMREAQRVRKGRSGPAWIGAFWESVGSSVGSTVWLVVFFVVVVVAVGEKKRHFALGLGALLCSFSTGEGREDGYDMGGGCRSSWWRLRGCAHEKS